MDITYLYFCETLVDLLYKFFLTCRGQIMFGGGVLKKLCGIGEPEGKAGIALGGSFWSFNCCIRLPFPSLLMCEKHLDTDDQE